MDWWANDDAHESDAIAEWTGRFRASAVDDYDFRPLWAGEGLDQIDQIEPAVPLVATLAEEAAATLTRLSGR